MFWTNPYFYGCVIVGIVGLWPRIAFAAKRAAAPSVEKYKPSLLQHASLVLPSLAVLVYLVSTGDTAGALVMVALFIACFAIGIMTMRSWLRAK